MRGWQPATQELNDVKLAHSSAALALAPRPSRHFPLTLFSLPSTILLSLLTSTVSLRPASYDQYRYLDQHRSCRLTQSAVFRRAPRSHSGTLPRDPQVVSSSSLGCCLLLRGPGRFAGYLPRLTGEARLGKLDLLRCRKRRAR
jgi:hypothetical protein